MVDTLERMIALEGAVNFRDLGGYEAGDGSADPLAHALPGRWPGRADRGRPRRAARAGHPDGHRPALRLRARTRPLRREAHPVAFHHLPFIDELPDAQDFDRKPGLLGTQYLEIVRDAGGQILAALDVLAAPTPCRPCSTALPARTAPGCCRPSSCSLLGVDEPTVVADYALSDEAMLRLRAKIIAQVPREPRDAREHRRGLLGRPGADGARCSTTAGAVRLGRPPMSTGSAPGRTSWPACGWRCWSRPA